MTTAVQPASLACQVNLSIWQLFARAKGQCHNFLKDSTFERLYCPFKSLLIRLLDDTLVSYMSIVILYAVNKIIPVN